MSARLQVHQAAWFIEERNITYVDRRDQFELMKDLQMFEYSGWQILGLKLLFVSTLSTRQLVMEAEFEWSADIM